MSTRDVATSRRWLASIEEDIVDPDLPIVDPHHHLWDHRPVRSWQPTYLLVDLRADAATGHNIVGTVFIECEWAYRATGPEHLRPVGETERVAEVAAESEHGGPPIRAIIGSCDLRLDTARRGEVLDALAAAGSGRFRGIRHRIAYDPTGAAVLGRVGSNEDLLGSAAFRAGVADLGRRGHCFEAWMYHWQLPALVHVAESAPETTIVVNHIGAPLGVGAWAAAADLVRSDWRSAMVRLARHENVVVKLGGIGMDILGHGWSERDRPPTSDEIAAAFGDHIRFLIDEFETSRCMFESNFPVDKMSCSYPVLWNAFKKCAAERTVGEREALFRTTAEKVYRF